MEIFLSRQSPISTMAKKNLSQKSNQVDRNFSKSTKSRLGGQLRLSCWQIAKCDLVEKTPHPLSIQEGKRKVVWRVEWTNLQNKGLISADRGTRATLMRTIPRSLFKSYTKDLSFPIFELVFQYRLLPLSRDRQYRYNIMILAARLLLCMITSGKAPYRRFPAWILA